MARNMVRESYTGMVEKAREPEGYKLHTFDGYDEYEDYDEADFQDAKEDMMAICDPVMSGDATLVTKHDTPNDTWGVFVLVLVKDFGDLWSCRCRADKIIRLTFATLALAANIFLQIAFLKWVFQRIVSPQVATTQQKYYNFRTKCFNTDGTFNEAVWESYPGRDELCQAGIANQTFITSILFLWTLQMLSEFRENFDLTRHIHNIPSLPAGIRLVDQVVEHAVDGTKEFCLVALHWTARLTIYVFVIIPKYGIIFFLLWTGYRWLSASCSVSDIILNALALAFITQIDNLIFMAVFPERMKESVTNTKLCVPQDQYETKEEKEYAEKMTIFLFYGRSFAMVAVSMIILTSYIEFFQSVIPEYNGDLTDHCRALPKAVPECAPSFFRSSSIDCFPYGPQPTVAR